MNTMAEAFACVGIDMPTGTPAVIAVSLVRDVFGYPVTPVVDGGTFVFSLQEHFRFFELPQLHVNFVLWRPAAWTPGPANVTSIGGVAGALLQVRRIFQGAAGGGFTVARANFWSAGAEFPQLPTFPVDFGQAADITQRVHFLGPYGLPDANPNSLTPKIIPNHIDIFIFGNWSMPQFGLAPASTACVVGDEVLPAVLDFNILATALTMGLGWATILDVVLFFAEKYWIRCPVVTANRQTVTALARTLAHELGHYVAWGSHPIFASNVGLMSQTGVSTSTAISADLAEDFLSSCWMTEGCP